MKKIISILTTIFILTAFAGASFTGATAAPTRLAILVDGKQVIFNAYTIESGNYFDLRDVAAALSGTSKQFDLVWNAKANSLRIIIGQPYSVDLDGDTVRLIKPQAAIPAAVNVPISDTNFIATFYIIDSDIYFDLFDLGKILDFYVDIMDGTMTISSRKGYGAKANLSDYTQETVTLVEASKLNNYASLKKKVSDEEFLQAYNAAALISVKYQGMGIEEQLNGIYADLRQMSVDELSYSMDSTHYSDVYGFFISKNASCAGATRAVGLCLNQLGIPYEHVNEGKYSHQWCRVNVDGTYWICDAYGMYVGPEPAVYAHPYFLK